MTTLYEHGTLAMLMAANLEGTISLKDLLKHGSQGLGTFTGLNGEVIILDNEVYQAESDGTVNHIKDLETKLPFASVHFPGEQLPIKFPNLNFSVLNNEFIKEKKLSNVFASIKINGIFQHIKIRVPQKQEKPYPSLLEVAEEQTIFKKNDVKGTLLGYYAPSIFGNVTAPGWHLHFISNDCQFAGHVLEFDAENISGGFEIFDSLEQHFPIKNQEFRDGEIDLENLTKQIADSES